MVDTERTDRQNGEHITGSEIQKDVPKKGLGQKKAVVSHIWRVCKNYLVHDGVLCPLDLFLSL